jgi:hypothetical protein
MNEKAEKALASKARGALRDHAADVGLRARQRFGDIDYAALLAMLEDRSIVRFPVRIEFDATKLQPGEFGWTTPLGDNANDGYCLYVHPHFVTRSRDLPLLIAYHLVSINYGDVATREEAEAFGAALLGLDEDDYYLRLCALADELSSSCWNGDPTCRS